ncbi:MAG TPA: hypothetical protein DCY95_04685, partial [Algoriphagus sp.]|nr:hypothetical protein [Algoriphagus sp.]
MKSNSFFGGISSDMVFDPNVGTTFFNKRPIQNFIEFRSFTMGSYDEVSFITTLILSNYFEYIRVKIDIFDWLIL